MSAMVLMIVGFIFLIKGADLLVDGAVTVARRFGVSDMTIGLTVVGFGTSTPELVVNIMSGVQGTTALAIGNVLGSNIANVFLILSIFICYTVSENIELPRFYALRQYKPAWLTARGLRRDIAELVLQDQSGWDRSRIYAVLASGQETTVRLNRHLPVHLLYWTAFVNAEQGSVFGKTSTDAIAGS
jgi:hypothetical protein